MEGDEDGSVGVSDFAVQPLLKTRSCQEVVQLNSTSMWGRMERGVKNWD